MSSACVAASGDDRVVAADPFQVVGVLLGHRRHVIDHENLRRHVRFGPGLSDVEGRCWNVDDDARSATRRTIDTERAVKVHHQSSNDGEPQTCAALLRRIEVVEDPSSLVSGHSTTGVGDRHLDGRQITVSINHLRRDRDATGFRLQAVHRVGDQILEDTPERDRVSHNPRQIRQVGLELDMLVPLRGAYDVGDQRVQIAIAPVQRRRQSLIARGQRLEIREAGIDRAPPLGEHRRKGAGSSRSTCARWRITFRSGMRPFLMSWLT